VEFNRICVIGMGYIGLPTACQFASRGLQVHGVDTNQSIVQTLNNGGVHIFEPGLDEQVKEAVASGYLSTSSTPQAADAFIIAVPTPFFADKKADMTYVRSASESIVPVLQQGNLVVLESTSPPLTTIDLVKPILEKSGLRAGTDFYLAYTPERVLTGQILRELVENARVIGGIDEASTKAGHDLYGLFVRGEIIDTDATTAEMVKLMENTYRDVNIAIANEFSRLAERFGVNVWEAIAIANRHPRVKILSPGPGVGGHCISVDPWFFVEAAPDITPLIQASRHVNDNQPHFAVQVIQKSVGEIKDKRIAVLGLSFKPDVDDLRESPAVEIAHLLAQAGASVTAFEPFKPDFKIEQVAVLGDLASAIHNAEILVILVAHQVLKQLDPAKVAALTSARKVVDLVNVCEPEKWKAQGFSLVKLGVGKPL
jgi:UDP-N-acetyl-D-mannosaminuronic acid dehydrogenase